MDDRMCIGVVHTPGESGYDAEVRMFVYGRGASREEALTDLARILRELADMAEEGAKAKEAKNNG